MRSTEAGKIRQMLLFVMDLIQYEICASHMYNQQGLCPSYHFSSPLIYGSSKYTVAYVCSCDANMTAEKNSSKTQLVENPQNPVMTLLCGVNV